MPKRGRSQSRTRQTKRARKNPYTRKRPAYERRAASSSRRFNKQVLNVIKRTAEPKELHTKLTSINTMNHNSFNIQAMYDRNGSHATWPLQGDGTNQRNGNEIYAKGFMIRGSMCFAGDRRGSTLRFYLVNPKDNTVLLNYEKMFQPITNSVAIDPLNRTNYPSAKLIGTYTVPDVSAPTMSVDGNFELIDTNVLIKKWIPFNKKIKFLDGTNAPTNINAYMALIVTCYDHNSASETDECVKATDLMMSFYYSDP
ncbi:hypothetical protein T484DRAFT_3650080 [Baffinella frigidus]|nr:hypothetical protein T484DRAFT_3650080 [Cryptophyta sp. CCMP2293]